MKTLSGKTALVTGASRGIGAFISRTLAREGVTVVGVARSKEGLEETRAAVEAIGGKAIVIPSDLGDLGAIEGLIAEAEREAGPIDVLVNNAGIEAYRRFQDYGAGELQSVLSVNLIAPMELTRQLLPKMLERGGHIVNIASLAGKKGVSFNSIYSASKAGMIMWTDALRQELTDSRVRVSVICPGYIRDAGMFHDDDVRPPRLLGTSTPQDVADAVISAIRANRPEVIVNNGPIRPLLALAELSPSLADRIVDWIGVKRLNQLRAERESSDPAGSTK